MTATTPRVSGRRAAELIRFHLQNAEICEGERDELSTFADQLDDGGQPVTHYVEIERLVDEAHELFWTGWLGVYGRLRKTVAHVADRVRVLDAAS